MKKLMNSRDAMIDDMIDGFTLAYPQIRRGDHPRVVRRTAAKDPAKVRLVIGNGSGHEPIAMGFVGEGLLDANVVGDVFSAPSPDLILEGLAEVAGAAGTILLISRHEGDVINGNAAAMMAGDDGLTVRPFLMFDDISSAPRDRVDDRRGAAGTLFVYKILGAAAEEGQDIDALLSLAADVRAATVTLAAALSPGISPLTGQPMFVLPDDEVFIGMGVHGEPGVARRKVEPVRDLVGFMVDALLADRPIARDMPTVVLINGMGGTTMMELLTVFGETTKALERQDIPTVSPLIGPLSTTQETAGFSISLLTPTPDMLRLWRAPHAAPLFPVVF